MDSQSILNIIIKAQDQASETLKGVGGAIQGAAQKAQEVGQSMQAMGAQITVLAAPFALFGKASIEAAQEAAKNARNLKITFGDMTDSVETWAKKAGAAVGVQSDDMGAYATQIFRVADSMGIAKGKASEMSEKATSLAVDMARFKGVEPDVAVDALTKALAGSTKGLIEFGIKITNADIETELHREGINKAAKDVDDATMAQVRMNVILGKTGDIQGLASKTTGSYADAQRRMNVAITEAKEALGERLMPILTPFIQKITDVVTKFSEMSPATQDIIVKILAVAIAAGPVIAAIGTVVNIVGQATGVLSTLAGILTGPVGIALAIGAAAVWAFQNNFMGFRDTVMAVFIKIQPVIESFVNFLQGKTSTKDFLSTMFPPKVVESIMQIFNKIKEIVQTFITASQALFKRLEPIILRAIGYFEEIGAKVAPILKNFAENVLPKIIDSLQPLLTAIQGLITNGFQLLGDILTWLWTNILQPVFEWISANIGPILNFIIPIIQTIIAVLAQVGAFIIDMIVPVLTFLWNTFTTVFSAVRDIISFVWNNILLPIFTNLYNFIFGFIIPVFQMIWNVVRIVFEAVKAKIEEVWARIMQVISPVIQWIQDNVVPKFNAIKDGVTSAFDQIKSVAEKVWKGVTDTFKSNLNIIIDFINSFIRQVNRAIEKVSGFATSIGGSAITFRIGEIPPLQKGTDYVPQEGLYHLHEGEQVVPKEYNPTINNNHNNNSKSVTIENVQIYNNSGLDMLMNEINFNLH